MEMRPGQWRGDEATRVSRSIQASRSHPSIIILTTTHHRLATHRHITSIAIKNLQTTLWLCCISYLPSSPLLRPHPLHTGAITRDKGPFTLLLPRRRATASSLSLYSHHFVCLDFQLPFSLAALVSKLLFGFSDRVSFSGGLGLLAGASPQLAKQEARRRERWRVGRLLPQWLRLLLRVE